MAVTMVTGGRKLPTDPQLKHVDQASSTVQYVGFAPNDSLDSEPVWQIARISTVGSITTTEFADDGNYSQVWDDRATLFPPLPPSPPPGPTGTDGEFTLFSDVSSVPASTITDVLTYTVAPDQQLSLARIEMSGDNIAVYEYYVNNVIAGRLRTYYGGPLNATFEFEDYPTKGLKPLVAGDVLKVRVTHQRPYVGAFEARIQGILLTTGA